MPAAQASRAKGTGARLKQSALPPLANNALHDVRIGKRPRCRESMAEGGHRRVGSASSIAATASIAEGGNVCLSPRHIHDDDRAIVQSQALSRLR